MLPTSKSVKQTAKELLKGRWPQLIGVTCIAASGYIVVLLAEQLLRMALGGGQTLGQAVGSHNLGGLSPAVLLAELTAALLLLFLWQPLYLGVQRWFWRLSGGADDTVGGVFHYFGSGRLYGRAVRFQLSLLLRILLTALVAFAPAILTYVLTLPGFYAAIGVRAPVVIADLWSLPSGLAALGLIAFIPWALRYFLAAYLFINDPELSPWQAVSLSARVTRGSRAAYLGLLLSFIGWLLLCLLALPVLFVLPYMTAAGAVFARYAIHAYNTGLQRAPSYGMY